MLRPPSYLTLVPTSAPRSGESQDVDYQRQTARLGETKSWRRSMESVLDLSRLPADVAFATTASRLFPGNSDIIKVDFGDYLQDLQDDLAAVAGREDGPRLVWSVTEMDLPTNVAITFVRVTDLLITSYFARALPLGQGGHIDVSFTIDQDAWMLTISDSGLPMESFAEQRCDSLSIARMLVLRHRGWLEMSGATTGTCCIAMIPRSGPEGIANAEPASILGSPKSVGWHRHES